MGVHMLEINVLKFNFLNFCISATRLYIYFVETLQFTLNKLYLVWLKLYMLLLSNVVVIQI